jgi:hypothetical protein
MERHRQSRFRFQRLQEVSAEDHLPRMFGLRFQFKSATDEYSDLSFSLPAAEQKSLRLSRMTRNRHTLHRPRQSFRGVRTRALY